MKNPWMKFYPSDWRADPALRSCTIAARGLWIEMLAIMHDATPCGSLLINGQRIDKKRLAALAGVPERECIVLLLELEGVGVFSRDDDGTIYSRRMRRDAAKSDEGRASVRRKWGQHQSANDKTRSERLSEARKKGRHTAEEWDAMIVVCGDRCVRCNDDQSKLVKDHINPIYKGGSDGIENLQPLCTKCNASKGPEDKDHRPSDWEKRLGEWLGEPNKTPTQKPEARSQKPEKKEAAREAAPSSDFEFEDFWEAWPNKVGKPAALKAFVAARRRAELDAIVTGVFAYIRDKPPDRPWLNPATFLNQNRWEDRPAQVANAKPKSTIIQAADDLRRKIAGFDGPSGRVDELRSGAGEAPARLLSHG